MVYAIICAALWVSSAILWAGAFIASATMLASKNFATWGETSAALSNALGLTRALSITALVLALIGAGFAWRAILDEAERLRTLEK